MTNTQKLKKLYSLMEEIEAYTRTLGKLQFDMQCCAPKNGMEQAGIDQAIIGKQLFKLTHNKTMEKLICELHEDKEGLSDVQKVVVDRRYEDYLKTKNITKELSYEMDLAFNKAYGDWLQAKLSNDFSKYRDSLESIIKYTRMSVELRDNKPASLYDACLNDYERGMNQEKLDAFFAALKARIVPLLKRIQTEGKAVRTDFLTREVEVPKQEKWSKYLLELEGLNQDALVLMTTEHPFTTNFGPDDVRVTTHYHEDHFFSNTFTTLHEGGHALFMQYEPAEFHKDHAANGMTNGMHECISRFYENIIGRSEAFIGYVYPKLKEIAGDMMADVSERELFEAVNAVQAGLLRTESDELTYCLHIMIRYEIEKEFMSGRITVDEIPSLWNAKYMEYLGVDVPGDGSGCLQDVHWTGMFGYFPSYALGNAYGAQILNTMKKQFDVDAALASGNLGIILDWMKANVFSTASLTNVDEWLTGITGEPLNVNYYLDYLEDKFTKLYELK